MFGFRFDGAIFIFCFSPRNQNRAVLIHILIGLVAKVGRKSLFVVLGRMHSESENVSFDCSIQSSVIKS